MVPKCKIMVFLLYMIVFLGKAEGFSSTKLFNICVVKSLNIKPYNVALEGFLEVLQKKGYSEGENLILNYYLIERRKENIIEEIRDKKPDLILTIGTEATQKIWQAGVADIPVVFSMVLGPVERGFVKTRQKSGNNFTGASMDIPSNAQIKAIKSVIPQAKKIGVVYNPLETGKVVERTVSLVKRVGLELKAIAITSPKEVPDAITNLVNKIDVLWLVPDSTVVSEQSLPYILSRTLKNRIPVLGYAAYVVKKGALLGLSCDYEDIGRQAGELSLEILRGEKPSNLPITVPRRTLLSVNIKAAKRVEIEVPPHVLKEAYEVFK